jgi:hypothetical protein
MVEVDTGLPRVTVEYVAELYAEYTRMDRPDYYGDGEENPYLGRISVIPRKATVYAMVPEGEPDSISLARQLLRGVGGRRKIRAVPCERHEINYNQFAKAGRIIVLYV